MGEDEAILEADAPPPPDHVCKRCSGYAPTATKAKWWWTGWEYVCSMCLARPDGSGGHFKATRAYFDAITAKEEYAAAKKRAKKSNTSTGKTGVRTRRRK